MKDELIQKLIDYIDKSKDFVLEQAPDVIREILAYHLWENIVSLIFLTFFAAAFIVASIILYHKMKDFSIWWLPLCLIFTLVGGFINCITDLIAIKISPKYFVIHQLVKLNKK